MRTKCVTLLAALLLLIAVAGVPRAAAALDLTGLPPGLGNNLNFTVPDYCVDLFNVDGIYQTTLVGKAFRPPEAGQCTSFLGFDQHRESGVHFLGLLTGVSCRNEAGNILRFMLPFGFGSSVPGSLGLTLFPASGDAVVTYFNSESVQLTALPVVCDPPVVPVP